MRRILTIAAILAACAAAPAATLELRPELEAVSPQVTVGDLASARGDAPAALLALPLGPAPHPGEKRAWSREEIANAIRAAFPGTPVDWAGAPRCEVSRPGRLIQPAEVRDLISRKLAEILPPRGRSEVCELAAAEPFLAPREAAVEVELAPSAIAGAWGGATLRITARGETLGVRSIRFRWAWVQPAWQAARAIPSGAELREEDFSRTQIDILQQQGRIEFCEDQLPPDAVLARPIAPGQLLTQNHIKARTLIRRGSPVQVAYNAGGINVTMSGVALEDGARGSTISIQNPISKKRILARVLDEGVASYVK